MSGCFQLYTRTAPLLGLTNLAAEAVRGSKLEVLAPVTPPTAPDDAKPVDRGEETELLLSSYKKVHIIRYGRRADAADIRPSDWQARCGWRFGVPSADVERLPKGSVAPKKARCEKCFGLRSTEQESDSSSNSSESQDSDSN
jgi:hypothetical protein